MRMDRMDNRFALLILARYIDADIHVRSLDLVVKGLANIMEQSRTAGDCRIKSPAQTPLCRTDTTPPKSD